MQNYIVLEITRNANGNIAVYPSAKESENAAKSKYHEILERAAVSNSPVHGAMLINYNTFLIDNECFFHEVTPEPVPEPETEEPTEEEPTE